MAPHWSQSFFTDFMRDLWHQATPPERTDAEAAFLLQSLAAQAGSRLLDVPCGAGRLSLALAAQGYSLTGVDQSGPFLAEARAGSAAAGLPITWVERDMRDLRWRGRFSGAFCMGNSFGVFDRIGTRRFLAAIGRALIPGARFVIDTEMAAEALLPEIEHRIWLPLNNLLVLVENDYDFRASRLDTSYTLIRDRQRETHLAHHWVFTIGEICDLLDEAGLLVESLSGDLDGTPFSYGDRRLVLTAVRR